MRVWLLLVLLVGVLQVVGQGLVLCRLSVLSAEGWQWLRHLGGWSL